MSVVTKEGSNIIIKLYRSQRIYKTSSQSATWCEKPKRNGWI